MPPPPPKPTGAPTPRPASAPSTPKPTNVSTPRQVVTLDDFGLQSPPPPRQKRKKAVPLIDRIWRWAFVLGMILGALMTLMIPYGDHQIAVADYKFTLPLSFHKFHVGVRWAIYMAMVIAGGFFWAKVAVRVCEKYFPQTRYVPRTQEEVSSLGSKIWRLDGSGED